ncbi:hypothetical protein [Amycolatopsis sp. RTGN1]|uniref:hypothetical protein n=1 Tax=Amycolatopsis ponsaeliensis TaxID=2992142 RepID=UPI00254A7EE6|nr:hypothetical protein [Amycolatopsis sp. RTGN1]
MIRLSDVPRRADVPDSSDPTACTSRAAHVHDRGANTRLPPEQDVADQIPYLWRPGPAQGAAVLMVAAMVAAMVALGLLAYSGTLR